MARYHPEHDVEPVYKVAAQWRDNCLIRDGSVLAPGRALWTPENLVELEKHFVQNLDLGQGTFLQKLEEQLENASASAKQLMAELLWLSTLFQSKSDISSRSKRDLVSTIWSWSGEQLQTTSEALSDDALVGIGGAGVAYSAQRWRELVFLIAALQDFKRKPNEDRQSLASSAWEFLHWILSLPGSDNRQLRHILPHLLFPDQFERIASALSKREILKAFAGHSQQGSGTADASTGLAPKELDQRLLQLRQLLAEQYGTRELDFFAPPLRNLWREATTDTAREPKVWIEKTIVRGRPDREDGAHAVGQALWSPQRSQGGANIYSNMLEVQPGDIVLHLTDNEAFTGISRAASLADDTFVGLEGTEWEGPAYRVALTEFSRLSSPLYRAEFLEREPYRSALQVLRESGEPDLFFNVNLDLNQGKYLTKASDILSNILNAAFFEKTGEPLPYFDEPVPLEAQPPADRFDRADILDSLFVEESEIEDIMSLWSSKTNLILQGAPGVGKTFVARSLAWLMTGSKSTEQIEFVQFHQSYSYEDFVQGYRPDGEGGFALKDGVLKRFRDRAVADPERNYVLIIDEINRGNLSKIFGELLVLVEGDKRGSDWAVRLPYDPAGPKFYLPENLFIVGTMNTADRSLTTIDFAMRRRFAFKSLDPQFASSKFEAALRAAGGSETLISKIRRGMSTLNNLIRSDRTNLGAGFCIGHSFFTPKRGTIVTEHWFSQIVETEIAPLLEEYWFDDPDKARGAAQALLNA